MTFDFYTDTGFLTSIAPQDITGDINGAGIDVRNFNAVAVFVACGANGTDGSNYLEFALEESVDNSTFTPVVDAELLQYVAGGQVGTFGVLNTGAAATFGTGYRGNKPYIRIVAKETGTVADALVSGQVVAGCPTASGVNAVT